MSFIVARHVLKHLLSVALPIGILTNPYYAAETNFRWILASCGLVLTHTQNRRVSLMSFCSTTVTVPISSLLMLHPLHLDVPTVSKAPPIDIIDKFLGSQKLPSSNHLV